MKTETYTEKKVAAKNTIVALRAEYGNASWARKAEIVAQIDEICAALGFCRLANGGC